MCVIFLAINQHPEYKFIVAANRDEFYERPTAHAEFWEENPNLLAGKDLVHGGTWLGVTKNGRFAAVTNFRNPNQPKGELSRGNLVKDFLNGDETPNEYIQQIRAIKDAYTGFNLIIGDVESGVDIAYYSNVSDEVVNLNSGIYGLSNSFLDSDWHKVKSGKAKFTKALADLSCNNLIEILADKHQAHDKVLPNTGVGIERERILSPIFIETPIYGTRCSSVLLVGDNNKVEFIEKSFVADSTSEIKECFVLIPKQERTIG